MIPTPKLSPGCSRMVPLPNFSWASAKDVWTALLQREQRYSRNPLMLNRHPKLEPRMRSILLNWLSEVSEVYELSRETYYLAVDLFDRYLSIQANISKEQLQLIGITCLFMASKMEEVYPPKLKDFAYVTDSACTPEQIITKELVILRCLKWKLSCLTVNSWLKIYLQLYSMFEHDQRSLEKCDGTSESDSNDENATEPTTPTEQVSSTNNTNNHNHNHNHNHNNNHNNNNHSVTTSVSTPVSVATCASSVASAPSDQSTTLTYTSASNASLVTTSVAGTSVATSVVTTPSQSTVVPSTSASVAAASTLTTHAAPATRPSSDQDDFNAPPKKRKRIALNSSNLVDKSHLNANNQSEQTVPITSASVPASNVAAGETALPARSTTDNANVTAQVADAAASAPEVASNGQTADKSGSDTEDADTSPDRRINKADIISSILGRESEEAGERLLHPHFSPVFFTQVAHLLDLSMLDIGSLRFPYNVISAAALYHFTNLKTVMKCTGLKVEQLQECIIWMTPFALTIRDEGLEDMKLTKEFNSDDEDSAIYSCTSQTHTVGLTLLEKAQDKLMQHYQSTHIRNQASIKPPSSPASMPSASSGEITTGPVLVDNSSPIKSPIPSSSHILTPPRSHSKQSTL